MDVVGYKIVRNALSKDMIELLKTQTKLFERAECFKVNKYPAEYPFGDTQCATSFSKYGLLCYEALLLTLKPIIEKEVGKELLPTYSYMRIYYKNSFLQKHTDRPSCEYSATICISVDNIPWDIYFNGNCVILYPGDMVIYKGMELEHWRETYSENEQIQVFLHYVEKNGCNSHFVNDNRPFIGIDR